MDTNNIEKIVIDKDMELEVIKCDKLVLNSNWTFWIHTIPKDWSINSFKSIATFNTVQDFWNIYNNLYRIGNFKHFNFYLMRDNNTPQNKSTENIYGGVWSIKLSLDEALKLWKELMILAIGENLLSIIKTEDGKYINNGLSLSVKSNTVAVIKIWISNNKYNNIGLLPNTIVALYNNYLVYKENNKKK